MGYYNYPIAHSYITRAYEGIGIGEDTIAGGLKKVLGDTTAQQQIKNLSADASKSATGAALDTFKEQFGAGFEGIKPYLPFIAIGGVAIIAILFLI